LQAEAGTAHHAPTTRAGHPQRIKRPDI
jgi:hypothetical protein